MMSDRQGARGRTPAGGPLAVGGPAMRSEPTNPMPDARFRPRPRGPRGFTTIELITVMAIIALLAGIIVIGFRGVSSGSQKNQTQTILERMRTVTSLITSDKTAGPRFFRVQMPFVYSYSPPTLLSPATATTPPPPAATWDGVPADSEDALFRTGLILRALLSNPEAKRIFDDVPIERKKQYHFDNTTGQIVGAPTATTTTTFTIPLDAWNNPILFVYDSWQDAGVGQSAREHVSRRITTPITPVGGLTDLYSVAEKGYWEFTTRPDSTDPGYTARYDRPVAFTNKIGDALRAPDRQPFWVSAGEDGKFRTHDDNVYSFEN